MPTGERRYRHGMDCRIDPPGTLSPIRIATLAECLRSRHGVAAYCARCRRWAQLDLAALVATGYGDRLLAECRPRCRTCQARGQVQLRAPVPGWQGPAAHGGAHRALS